MKDLLKPGDRVLTRDGKEYVVFDHRMVQYPTSVVTTVLDANDYDDRGKRKPSFCDTSDQDIVRICRPNHTSQYLAPVNNNWETVFSAPTTRYGIMGHDGYMYPKSTFGTISEAQAAISTMIHPDLFCVVKIEEVR